jgi:hypothetical protein
VTKQLHKAKPQNENWQYGADRVFSLILGKGGIIMLARIGKTLGIFTPLISLWSGYQMWFGFKYVGSSSENPTIQMTVSAFQFALDNGSKAILFWPIFLFVISVIGAMGAWHERPVIVWSIVIILLIVSILGVWTIGSLVFPLAGLLFISAALLTIQKKKASD